MRAKRQTAIDIQFASGQASGWHFGVAPAFRDALDIKLTARVVKTATGTGKENIWTRGAPPDYGFDLGDTFHAPAGAAALPWAQALQKLTMSLQVVAVDGAMLTVAATAYQNRQAQPPALYTLPQTTLADWLRSGVQPSCAE